MASAASSSLVYHCRICCGVFWSIRVVCAPLLEADDDNCILHLLHSKCMFLYITRSTVDLASLHEGVVPCTVLYCVVAETCVPLGVALGVVMSVWSTGYAVSAYGQSQIFKLYRR